MTKLTPGQLTRYLRDRGFRPDGSVRGVTRWKDAKGFRVFVPPKIECEDDEELVAEAVKALARRAGTNPEAMAGLIISRGELGLDWDYRDCAEEEITTGAITMAVEGCGGDEDRFKVVTATGQVLKVLGVAARRGEEVHLMVEIPS